MAKELCEPYRTLLEKLLRIALKKMGDDLVSLVVYGSVARCEARRDSDVDLLIVLRNPPRSRLRRQDLFMELEEELEADVEELRKQGFYVDFSPIIKSVEEASRMTPLYLDMVEDAVVLYDRDGFFANVLERLRKRLAELGAERVRVGRRWYWRLKREYRFGEVIEIE
ncbi:MAG: nucleotidyltransferase domain-containing protein [Desulfurococcaceae archaeon]